jgi:hypothetical protein
VAFYPENDRIGKLNLASTLSHFFLAICGVRCASSGEAFAMRNLPALFVIAVLALLNTTAIAQAPPGSLWYNGDYTYVNGLANERNTLVSQAGVYDDFNVTATMTIIASQAKPAAHSSAVVVCQTNKTRRAPSMEKTIPAG